MDYQKGKTFFINFEIIKPGQNDDFTIWLKKAINIEFDGGGVTPTLFGEGYLNFGYLGNIIYFIIIALMVNKLDKMYYKSKNVYFVTFFIWIILSSVRGGFSNSLIILTIFSIVNAYIWLVFKNVQKRRN